jgi:hypothetical protein
VLCPLAGGRFNTVQSQTLYCNMLFWDVTPFSLVEKYGRLDEPAACIIYFRNEGRKFLRNFTRSHGVTSLKAVIFKLICSGEKLRQWNGVIKILPLAWNREGRSGLFFPCVYVLSTWPSLYADNTCIFSSLHIFRFSFSYIRFPPPRPAPPPSHSWATSLHAQPLKDMYCQVVISSSLICENGVRRVKIYLALRCAYNKEDSTDICHRSPVLCNNTLSSALLLALKSLP